MGKTLGSIITIGAAIAVNVIPGVGQVISGAIVGTLGGTFASVGIASAITSALTFGVTMAGLQSLGGVLGLGPSAPKSETTETSIKNPRPVRISAYGEQRLYGSSIAYETAEDGRAVDVYAVHDGRMDGLIRYYLNDDPVTLTNNSVNKGDDGRYAGYVIQIYSTLGLPTGTAIGAITSAIPSVWSSNHRGDGVVQLATVCKPVKSKKYLEVYPNGVPIASMAARWQRCPDPRVNNPLNEDGWTWTENPIRHLLHYMIVREGVNYEKRIKPAIQYWREAADVCDAPRSLKSGGTEPMYRGCVVHKSTDSHASVRSAIMQTCDGWLATRHDGAFVVYAGKYYSPTVEIGPDELLSFEWNGVGVDDDKAVNEIICNYVSSAHDYSTVETDAWRDEDDIAERGEVISEQFDPQAPSWGQARALAKRIMARKNAPFSGTCTTNVAGRKARGQRYINLRLEEAGIEYFNGPVEIIEVTRNIATGGITFSWTAADPNIDAWNPATEEGNPAPVTNRIAPQPLETPVIDDATAVFSNEGGYTRLVIDVGSDERTDLTWYLRWKESVNPSWIEVEYPDVDPSSLVQIVSDSVPANALIDVSVAYAVGDGRLSDWSETVIVNTTTESLPPSPVTDATVVGSAGQVEIAWRNPTSANYASTRLYRNTTNNFSTATQVNGDMIGALGSVMVYDDTPLTAGTYYYWLRTVSINDVTGNPTPTGSVVVT